MDIEKYIAGKSKGVSGIELHGDSTILISYPAGFDPNDGSPLPTVDKGYQIADIVAMKEAADKAVQDAQEKLEDALTISSKYDELLADIEPLKKQIASNLSAVAIVKP